MSADSVVLKGQHVQDETGKDLVLIDPADQPYNILYADGTNSTVSTFERDSST